MTYVIILAVLVVLAVAYAGKVTRKMLHRLAGQVEQMRGMTTIRLEYRLATAADADRYPPNGGLDALMTDLPGLGCTLLGDQIEVGPDGTVYGLTRWFADGSGSVVGWGGFAGPSAIPVMMFFSEAQDGVFVATISGPRVPSLVQPPFVRRRDIPFERGVRAALDQHRATVQQEAGGETGAVRTHGLEEATSLVYRMRAAILAWRKSQPPDALLEQDVRMILGETHANYAEALLKILRSRTA